MSNLSKLPPLKSPDAAAKDVALRARARRRALGITQQQLSERSGVALGTLRRFEQTGQISFNALVSVCRALDCESDLDALFAKHAYRSIQEVIDEQQ